MNIRFMQISVSADGLLYALDINGRVWVRRPIQVMKSGLHTYTGHEWVQIDGPTEG
jgi:hypothetical protein